MSNMSYCRFENTSADLTDCLEALSNREIEAKRERKIAGRMIKEFLDFCESEGLIEEYNSEAVDELLAECESGE